MEMDRNKLLRLSGFLLISIITIFAVAYACTHEPESIYDFPEICFESEVLPLFQNSCGLSDCHDESSAKEGYIFTDYSSIIKGVKPGDPYSSPAYTSLTARDDDRMPPDNVLPLQSRQVIRIWIEQGAQNTICIDTSTQNGGNNGVSRACFERDILPVFLSSCGISGCHDEITRTEGFSFTNYNGILRGVNPGNPEESEVYAKITEDNLTERMPPPGYDPLPQAQIDSIYKWILYGALNEDCGVICDTTSLITFSGNVWPIIELNCRGCHSGISPSGNILLTGYSQVSSVVANGLLGSVIRGIGESPQMPPTGALPECNIRQVELWIENGYPNN